MFAGISALQIVPQKISWREDTLRSEDGTLRPHFSAHAGYRFLIGDDFNFIPSIMMKYVSTAPVQPEINARLMYRDRFWTGVGFRNKEGFNATAGLLISQRLNVSYSYDYVTSRLNNYTKGTHEIIVGFLIGNRGAYCPSNIW